MGLGLGFGLGFGLGLGLEQGGVQRVVLLLLLLLAAGRAHAYMVKGHGIGGFGGGKLEHQRQWLGVQRADLFLAVLSCSEPPGTP